MKKVSIAIMCYNQENFIKETIDSCLNQTYKNIEICISDDCSTDKTYDIIIDYQKKYPEKIKSFRQKENMGKISLCINANSIIKMCDGEYITLLDGDDIMLPDRIKKQVDFLENHSDYIGVSGWVEAFNSENGEVLGNLHNNLKVKNRTIETLITYGNSIPPCLTFRNFINKPKYEEKLKIMGDWLFYIELSILGKIGHINEYLGKYRIHSNNSINKDLSYDYFKTLEIIDRKYIGYTKHTKNSRSNYYIGSGYTKIINKNFKSGVFSILKGIYVSPLFGIKKCILFLIDKFKNLGGIK